MSLSAYVPDVPRLVEAVVAGATSRHSSLHGESHWKCVAWTGLELARETPGCDAAIVFLFALLHDSQRLNDGHDREHGPRAVAFAWQLQDRGFFTLPPERLDTLVRACDEHTTGTTTDDPTVGACWDADRLNLWRIGVRPDARWLSTAAAKDADRIDRARRLEGGHLDWAAIADAYQSPSGPRPAAHSVSPVRRVEGELYYHIRRDSGPDWAPGTVLTFGVEKNPFRRKVETVAPAIVTPAGRRYPVNEVAKHVLEVAAGKPRLGEIAAFYHFDPVKTLAEMSTTLDHYLIAVRDQIFEEIRRQEYPDRPSRDTCGWLIPHAEPTLTYWKEALKADGMRVYTLSCTGTTFSANYGVLRLRTYSLQEFRQVARRYWSGAGRSTAADIEVLFGGSATVVNVIADRP